MTALPSAQPEQKPRTDTLATGLRNVDARVGLRGLRAFVPREAQQTEVNELRAVMPDLRVEFDEATGATRSLWNIAGYLTPADGRDPRAIAEDFMAGRALLLGLSDADVVDVELTDSVYSRLTGVTHLYYRQRLGGIPVYNAQLQVNIARDGRILSINNGFLPSLTASVPTLRPATSALSAVSRVASHLGVRDVAPSVTLSARGLRQTTEMAAPELSTEPIKAELMLLPIQRGEARLVWNLQVWTLDNEHAFDFTVDAETGQIWTRFDWVAADQHRVYPRPVESPIHTSPVPPSDGRVVVTNPADATASPFGWHDTNGVAGAEFTTTQGNNVHAYVDANNDNLPDSGSSPDCGVGLNCDFAINLAGAPTTYQPAAVTNLFYWNNLIHDIQYRYGFDEAAGNFQVNNYGRGGSGNDSVQAEAQDSVDLTPSSNNRNNANFATPPDGSRPRMQMYVWTTATPNLDGDLDSGIVVHEYGHGISNRLVGGPSNVNCLSNQQQPGEGISDWLSLVYTARSTDTAALARGIGTYALAQPTTGPGIRDLPYSTDNTVNNWTYQSISSLPFPQVPHRVGAVWAQGMWEVYWALVGEYGFSPDLYNATGGFGNQRAMLYHNEGLKFASCSPGFTQVRDGIIQAAQTINGGADVCRLWSAFAAFGLGANAVNPSPGSIAGIVNGFDVPVACGGTANPNMTIDDVSVTEGNSGTSTATFTVSLATASTSESRVSFATADGTATAPVSTLTTNTATTIPALGPASPYPVTLNVAGLTGTIASLAVRVNGLSHTWSDDLDLLLVGPGGQSSMFMSDIGGGGNVVNINLTFQDGAPPPPGTLVTGTFSPTNLGATDAMPGPAPAGPYGTPLSVFNGTDPNGLWSLYVVDDTSPDGGELDGFSLLIATTSTGDYSPTSGELIFPAGTTTRTISVDVNGDVTVEPNETFFVNLSNPVNATLLDAQGMGTILNDDGGGGSAPTTNGDAYSTPFATPLNVSAPGVLTNDLTNGGGAMTAQLVTPASSGSLSFNADGSFTYTPNGGFVGADSFTYRAVNSVGPGNVATVSVTVNPGPPTTAADNYATPFNTPLNVSAPGVLTNDITNGGGAMTAQVVTAASNGSLSLNADGSFTYTPNGGFVGADSFTYRAVNSVGPGNVATVSITVNAGSPTTVADNYVTPFNTPLVVAAPGVLGNDTSNNGAMTAQLVTNGTSGVVALNPDGSFTYTPNGGFVGADSFTYRAVNSVGPGNVATVTVTVAAPTTVQPPSNFRVDSVVGTTVTLRWDVPSIGPAPTGFTLEGGVSPGEVLASIPTGSSAPVFSFVAPTGSFYIRMHSVAGADRSVASNEVPLHVNVPVTPSAPSGLLGMVNGSSLALAWKNTFTGGPPAGLVLDVTGSLATSIPLGLGDSFAFAGVPPGTYNLSLRATNAGGASPPSNTVTLTFPGACSGAPQPPANFVGYKIGSTVYVAWDLPAAGPAPTGYVLSVTGAFVGSFPTTGRAMSGVVAPGTYNLSVVATNPCGSSAASPVQVVTVP